MPKLETTITVDTTVIRPFTAEALGWERPPVYVHIQAETNPLRFRYYGASPTGSAGHLLAAGGQLILQDSADIQELRMRAVSDPVTLTVTAHT